MNHPSHIAWLVCAQDKRLSILEAAAQDAFNCAHRLEKSLLILVAQLTQHLIHLIAGALVKESKSFLPTSSQAEEPLAPIILRTDLFEQSLLFEASQRAAQVSSVDPQFAAHI